MKGLGNESDGRGDRKGRGAGRQTIIILMNEGSGRHPQAIAQSLGQASVALTSLS